MSKIRVAVIFGGKSNEHDVSVVSATHVIKSIPKDKYDVICIGITKKGHWMKYIGDVDDIASNKWEQHPDNVPCVLSPDPLHKGFIALGENGEYQNVKVDVIFPVLHGKNGEDGTIQGLFQLAEIPFVGCDCISSANCMDKGLTHTVLDANGIKTAKWVGIITSELSHLDKKCDEMESKLGYPMFVKPANCGSSVGVSKAKNRDELKSAIKLAFAHDSKVIVEETIVGMECECAVMGNDEPFASTVGEVCSANDEFYDFDAKYYNSDSRTVVNPDLPGDAVNQVREAAKAIFRAVDGYGLARVDFFVKDDGTVVFNEINTLPGFTSISMYPKLMEHLGMKQEYRVDKLIEQAMENAART